MVVVRSLKCYDQRTKNPLHSPSRRSEVREKVSATWNFRHHRFAVNMFLRFFFSFASATPKSKSRLSPRARLHTNRLIQWGNQRTTKRNQPRRVLTKEISSTSTHLEFAISTHGYDRHLVDVVAMSWILWRRLEGEI